MKNITVSVDEETHRLARIRAAELDTSVSALVREFVRSLAGSGGGAAPAGGKAGAETGTETPLARRRRRLRELFADFDARSVGVSARLTREELYDEAMNVPDTPR